MPLQRFVVRLDAKIFPRSGRLLPTVSCDRLFHASPICGRTTGGSERTRCVLSIFKYVATQRWRLTLGPERKSKNAKTYPPLNNG